MASIHLCHLAFSGGTTLAHRSSCQHTRLRSSDRFVQVSSVSSKLLQASNGLDITYQHEQMIDYNEVSLLLQKVGWPPRRQSRMQTAVENSFFLATLRAHHSSENAELIGFARIGILEVGLAVSDGAFNAQIWDVIIDPAFQEKGLGKQLIEEIVRYLITLDIKNITTFAERGGSKFYEKVGFQSDPDGVKGMFWRQLQ